MFAPRLIGLEAKVTDDPLMQQLKFRLEHNGEPMPVMPFEDVDELAPKE